MIGLKIKENKYRVFIILMGLFLISSWFYWFQIRPAQIKHDCSWIEVHEKAIHASPGVPIEEVEASRRDNPQCKDWSHGSLSIPRSGYQSVFQNNGADLDCFYLIKNYKAPQAAQPAKDWWRAASSQEYQFCLHDKGL